jgi:hypothetical protein
MTPFLDRRRAARRPGRLAVATAAAAAFAALAAPAGAHLASKPANTSAPTISGTPQVGDTLTADVGNWSGSSPLSFQYQWRRCGPAGGSCANIPGETASTYVLVSGDVNNTLRVRVTASNSSGSASAASIPTPQVTNPPSTTTTAPATTTATTTSAPASGCPAGTGTVPVTEVTSPSRLQINTFQATPAVIPGTMSSFTLRVVVTDTCGQPVQGALVYATAVPFGQVTIPPQGTTGADGSVTLSFPRLGGFPATSRQQLLAMFIRANKPGESILAGITTSRLVSIPVHLH